MARLVLFICAHLWLTISCHFMPTGSRSSASQRGNFAKCKKILGKHTDIPIKVLDKVAKELGCDTGQASMARAIRGELADVHTPLGNLIITVDVPMVGEEPLPWVCINPLALLYYCCLRSAHFAKFFSKHLGGILSSLTLYTDETTPGNVLRPDMARKIQCVYFTWMELPYWFRSRKIGWLPLGFMKSSRLAQVEGGLAVLTKVIVKLCFGEYFSFSIGVRCPFEGDTMFLVRSTLECFLNDMDAHRGALDLKGPSGIRNCTWCKNIVRGVFPPAGSYEQNFKTCMPEDFDPHTPESLQQVVDLVRTAHETLEKPEFKKVEQAAGLVFNPHGVMFAQPPILSMARVAWVDWVHTYVASGGVLQWEINLFCVELVNCKVSFFN
jgi:hypothetical protein